MILAPPGEPLLLTSIQTDLFLLGLRSGSLDVLSSTAEKAILSVDYDWTEQRVFWVTVDTDSIRWSSLDHKTTGTLMKGRLSLQVQQRWRARSPSRCNSHRHPSRLCGRGLAGEEPVLDRRRQQPDRCHQAEEEHGGVAGPQRHPGPRPRSASLARSATTERVSQSSGSEANLAR